MALMVEENIKDNVIKITDKQPILFHSQF